MHIPVCIDYGLGFLGFGLGVYGCTNEDQYGRESSRNKGSLDHANISFEFECISLHPPLPQREVQYLSTEVR
jgi:hypothetical protein